jgi:hypothetical protein
LAFKYLRFGTSITGSPKAAAKLYELSKALKAKDGDRAKKLFQFLNEIGARALRIQLGRVREMAESSADQRAYEKKIVERFGGPRELELVVPSSPPAAETLPLPFEDPRRNARLRHATFLALGINRAR